MSLSGFVLMAGMLLRIFLQGPTLRSVLPALPAASGEDYSTDEDHVTDAEPANTAAESSHSDDDMGVSASSDSDEERSPQENGEVRRGAPNT